MPIAQIDPTTPLADLSLDSLEFVNMVLQLENEFGVELDAEMLMKAGTLGGVAEILANGTGKGTG